MPSASTSGGGWTCAPSTATAPAARDQAVAAGHHRLWLITTNDNTRALRFYQRWGMDLCAFYRHGARRSREAKPALPHMGADGIPLEHELELELWCSPSGSHATRTNL